MAKRSFYKSRLRNKGQVILTRAQNISPGQAWFWSKRWQRMEYQAQADIDKGRIFTFENVEDALVFLDQGITK